jgi:iron complex transport system ATP-binding protein
MVMIQMIASGMSVALGARTILPALDLTFQSGDLIGIVGPNGAGKSTLLRALAGLQPYAGSVKLNGREVGEHSPQQLARLRAYLPQGGGVHWPIPVSAVVALGRFAFQDANSASGEAAIRCAMAAADVERFAARPVDELSGGERARVLLARALAAETPVVLADEPAAQLDPRHACQALEVLRAKADSGALVVVALHDLTAAARFCDKVLMMDDGRSVAFGPPDQVLSPERLQTVFGVDAHIGQKDGAPFVVPLRVSAAAC